MDERSCVGATLAYNIKTLVMFGQGCLIFEATSDELDGTHNGLIM